jgi:hypothetical protein
MREKILFRLKKQAEKRRIISRVNGLVIQPKNYTVHDIIERQIR